MTRSKTLEVLLKDNDDSGDDDDNNDDDDNEDDDDNGDDNGGVRFHRRPLAAVGISNCLRLQNHPSIILP